MSDADCTAEADEAELERIRRLIAETQIDRAESAVDDRTIEAEPVALERLRHIASSNHGGTTRLAPSGFPPPTTPAPAATHPPVRARATPLLPPVQSRRPRQVPSVSAPAPAASQLDGVAPLASSRAVLHPTGPWVPPPRSMRPEPEAKPDVREVRRWRLATFALTAALVALILGWVVLGRGSADDPTPTSVPGATYPASNRPITTTQTSSESRNSVDGSGG